MTAFSVATDAFLTYQFIKRIILPFNKWPAYKLGIIDEKGKVLRKSSDLKTEAEKNAWRYFDRLTCNLKKILAKIPGGGSMLGATVATALLLREEQYKTLTDDELETVIMEEIANVAGGGQIAGIGVGPQGEPPAGKAKLKKLKDMMRRQDVRNN